MSSNNKVDTVLVHQQKSWRILNQERKIRKKKFKEENLLKKLKNLKKLEELNKIIEQSKDNTPKNAVSTISLAIPGSILENAQSGELRAYLAGQIARAACIFQVDEIIVFDDVCQDNPKNSRTVENDDNETEVVRSSSLQLARILQYLECPQYLRKFFFPLHNDLQYSGLLNPLDAPHHLRQQNFFLYREGVVKDSKTKGEKRSYVNVGLLQNVLVDKSLTPGIRVTVKIDTSNEFKSKKIRGKIVAPDEPRQETGIYWGYSVRIAKCLSKIFTQSPYKGGYDLTIGTSDKGDSVHEIETKSLAFNHALIVFGGLKGLEAALECDDKLDVSDPRLLFDHYINVVEDQGSRTIRTEEAVLIAMSAIQDKWKPQISAPRFDLNDFVPQSADTVNAQSVDDLRTGSETIEKRLKFPRRFD